MIVRYPADRLLVRLETDEFGGIVWEKYEIEGSGI